MASVAFAQEYNASLFGDGDRFERKAHVALTDSALRRVYEAETNAGGLASFVSLRPGQYSLEITKTGFDNLRILSNTLAVWDQQRLAAQLKLSAGTTSVTVTAQPESVSTTVS